MSEGLIQRRKALRRANAIRMARADTKRAMKQRGQAWSVELACGAISEPEWTERRWAVRDLLTAIPGFGPFRVDRILRRAVVPASATLSDLTDRQRAALIARLRESISTQTAA